MALRASPPAASSTDSSVSVERVWIQFTVDGRPLTVLQDVSLDIAFNEFLCILGPSGCGKSTLLKALAGLVEPVQGTLRVGNRTISGPGADRALVFQEDALFPWMTVADNVAFSLKIRGVPPAEIESVVDRYLNMMGLDDFRNAWPRQLSGGMKKRVDLARAYASDPQVLLLDEPFGSVDIMTKEQLQQDLQVLLLNEPKTAVFVTHDLEEALYLGDRVVLLTPQPGQIQDSIEVPWPRPRADNIKLQNEFIQLRRRIKMQLEHALHPSHNPDP